MGLDVATLVSSTLGNIGQDITKYMDEQRQRRNSLVDTQIKHMFEEGTKAYAERKTQRKQIKQNIQYFQSLGFNRRDVEKFASLPQKEIDRIQAYIRDRQAKAEYDEKPFDAAGSIGLTVDETGRGITKEEPLKRNEWVEQTLQNVMGVVDPNKFESSEEQTSFGDNFREHLGKQFGLSLIHISEPTRPY